MNAPQDRFLRGEIGIDAGEVFASLQNQGSGDIGRRVGVAEHIERRCIVCAGVDTRTRR